MPGSDPFGALERDYRFFWSQRLYACEDTLNRYRVRYPDRRDRALGHEKRVTMCWLSLRRWTRGKAGRQRMNSTGWPRCSAVSAGSHVREDQAASSVDSDPDSGFDPEKKKIPTNGRTGRSCFVPVIRSGSPLRAEQQQDAVNLPWPLLAVLSLSQLRHHCISSFRCFLPLVTASSPLSYSLQVWTRFFPLRLA